MLSFKPARASLLGASLIGQFLLLVVAAASLPEGASAAVAAERGPFDSAGLRVISDADAADLANIKYHIANDYSEFKTVDEAIAFLDKVKLLVQKHPKNVAFAQDELKDLFKFLSQEIVTKLIRLDTDPFILPISDERLALAQRALEEDELTRKLFSAPVRSLVEARKQPRPDDGGNHKDGNFFTNFWCKLSGGCQH